MFDLTSVWLLMFAVGVFWMFWQSRRFAEIARNAAIQYCQTHHLQLLSTALSSVRFSISQGPQLILLFELHYSADGIRAKQGEIQLINGKVSQISHWS